MELDPDLAEARQALAQAYTWYDWEWDRAESEYQRAISLDPQDPQTRTFYSHFLSMMKRADESAAQIARALEIDPFNPFHHIMYGMQLMLTGKDAAAVVQLRKSVEMARHWNERAYDLKDHDMAYLAVIPRSRELSPDPRFHDLLRRMNLPT